MASLQVASPYIHLSGWVRFWIGDQSVTRSSKTILRTGWAGSARLNEVLNGRSVSHEVLNGRSVNHIGLVQWSRIVNNMFKKTSRTNLQAGWTGSVRLNEVLNGRSVSHKVLKERSVNHIGLVQWSRIVNLMCKYLLEQFFKQDEQENLELSKQERLNPYLLLWHS